MAKVLITGGAGFIGSNLARTWLSQTDDSVVVVDKLGYAGRRDNLDGVEPHRLQFIEGDISDPEVVRSAIRNVDTVVHLAAESHNDRSLQSPSEFIQSNLVGTFNILEAVREGGQRLHHVSTDEVYGDLELDDPQRFTELTAYQPSSPYSSTKAGSDMLVRAWGRSFGVQATISNCSNNFGPRQHVEKFIPRQITNILSGRRPRIYGDGRNVRDWIHVDDHNSAVMDIVQKGRIGETYLIGADGERNNIEVVSALLVALGRPADEFDMVADRSGHDRRYAIDATKLRNQIGWQPTTGFEQGLSQTIKWYQDNANWWAGIKEATESAYLTRGQ